MTVQRTDTVSNYQQRILRVLIHIQQNLDDALSLEELADIAHFSPFHFHRVFRGLVGESVRRHVRRLRLELAAMRLKHTQRPITAIAFEAGYEAHESFTRAFSRAFEVSPSAFRDAATLDSSLASPSGVHLSGTDTQALSFVPANSEEFEMNVEIKTIEPMRVAFARHIGPYDQVGDAWERLMDWVGRECLFGPDMKMFGLCHDDPEATPPDKIRYDACVTIAEPVTPVDDIGVLTIPGGRYAVTLHEGPYSGLNETYAKLVGRWFPGEGLEPGDPPALEFYVNDPDSTEPEDLLTDVCFPIAGGY